MKRDLEIAREIQTWLVPSAPPDVPGAEIAFASRPPKFPWPAILRRVFRHRRRRGRGKLTLVIADVAGKSIPAALLMATLQASLRTIAGEGRVARGFGDALESLRVRATVSTAGASPPRFLPSTNGGAAAQLRERRTQCADPAACEWRHGKARHWRRAAGNPVRGRVRNFRERFAAGRRADFFHRTASSKRSTKTPGIWRWPLAGRDSRASGS